jgi:hypothetical protein
MALDGSGTTTTLVRPGVVPASLQKPIVIGVPAATFDAVNSKEP